MGFLWFGTQGGLNRFDGREFKLFTNEPFATEGLSHNLVQTMYLDGDILWVGTYGGLNRLDLATERFTVYRNQPEDAASLSHDVVVSISRDASGRLWVGTLGGLNLLDEENGRFKRFLSDPANPSTIPSNVVRSIRTDRSGRLWIGTSGGLCRRDDDKDGFVRYLAVPGDQRTPPSNTVMSIAPTSDGKFWLGCWGGGLALFDPERGEVISTVKLEDDRIYTVYADPNGTIYAGTWGGGLFACQPAAGTVQRFQTSSNRGALSHDTVYSLFRDRSGELWVGTNGGGVNKLSAASRGFDTILADAGDPDALPPGKIQSVLVDRSKRLWVGVYNGGVNLWQPERGAWKHYRYAKDNPRALPNDIPNDIYEDAAGTIWVATNGGLSRWRPESDDFETLKSDPARPEGLSSDIIYCVMDAPGGNLWVGTYQSGLEYWDRKRGVFVHYPSDPANPRSLSDNLVYRMAYDHAGRLWVATNRGLNRLDQNGFTRYLYDPANKSGISSNSLRDLLVDRNGILWVASAGGGIMRYRPETDDFAHFLKADGLPSNVAVKLLEGADGAIWVATQAGLVTLDVREGTFQHLTVWNDLRDREFNSGGFRAPDGSMYLGSLGQLYRFRPERIAVNPVPPEVAVTAIEIAGKSYAGQTAAPRLKRLQLDWQANSVRIGFAALDFRDPERNVYQYRLTGFDKDWSTAGFGRNATYTNLPGGDYVFEVRAANADGVWSIEPARLELSVATPPFLTWPAMLAYAVGLGFVVFQLTQLRNRQVLAAKVRELLAVKSELEDANRQLSLLSMIDPLTGIANRRKLDEALEHLFAHALRRSEPLAAIMIDIDHFKPYNDHYGHQAGDDCLHRVAASITASLERSTDVVARYGGEEFLVVLPETELAGALVVAEKIRLAVANLGIAHLASNTARVVTVSLGVASITPDRGAQSGDLVNAADARLYEAKTAGRNRVAG